MTEITPLPYVNGMPFSTATPFTYREGVTMLELVSALKRWAIEIVPELNGILGQFWERYQLDLDALKSDLQATKDQWQALFDQFMLDVVAQIAILNDKAVSDLMKDVETLTGTTLRQIINEYTTDVVANATSAEVDLDSVYILSKFPATFEGGTEFPQGFSINDELEEIYVSAQSGTSLRIDVRNFAGELLRTKKFTVADGAYSEGIPWFINNVGNLSFVIQASAVSDTYNILDYETGTISADIPRPGKSRIDSFNGELFTSDAQATWLNKFYVYDFDSIANGIPVQKTVTPVNAPGPTIVKSQAVAVNSNHIYLYGGDQSEDPGLSMYDRSGQLVIKRVWEKSALRNTLLMLDPTLQIEESYFHESEGATNYKGKLVTGHIIDGGENMESTMFLLAHDATRGTAITPTSSVARPMDSDWQNVTLTLPWGQSPAIQYRLIGGEVQFRGELFNAEQLPGAYTTFMTLPSGYRPSISMRFPVTHTQGGMGIRVDPGGNVLAAVQAQTGAPRPLNSIRFRID